MSSGLRAPLTTLGGTLTLKMSNPLNPSHDKENLNPISPKRQPLDSQQLPTPRSLTPVLCSTGESSSISISSSLSPRSIFAGVDADRFESLLLGGGIEGEEETQEDDEERSLFLMALCNCAEPSLISGSSNVQGITLEGFSSALLTAFEARKRSLNRLIMKFARKELKNTVDGSTLFRGSSVTVSLFTAYMKSKAAFFLRHLLTPILQDLQTQIHYASTANLEPFSFEVDPNRVSTAASSSSSPSEIAERNRQNLILFVDKALNLIYSTVDAFPPCVKELLHSTRSFVAEKFPQVSHQVVGGFFFLRFLCPALVSPESFGITLPPPPSAASTTSSSSTLGSSSSSFASTSTLLLRNVILLTKVLQSASNDVEFGDKEPYMTPLNPLLIHHKPLMSAFLDKLSLFSSSSATCSSSFDNAFPFASPSSPSPSSPSPSSPESSASASFLSPSASCSAMLLSPALPSSITSFSVDFTAPPALQTSVSMPIRKSPSTSKFKTLTRKSIKTPTKSPKKTSTKSSIFKKNTKKKGGSIIRSSAAPPILLPSASTLALLMSGSMSSSRGISHSSYVAPEMRQNALSLLMKLTSIFESSLRSLLSDAKLLQLIHNATPIQSGPTSLTPRSVTPTPSTSMTSLLLSSASSSASTPRSASVPLTSERATSPPTTTTGTGGSSSSFAPVTFQNVISAQQQLQLQVPVPIQKKLVSHHHDQSHQQPPAQSQSQRNVTSPSKSLQLQSLHQLHHPSPAKRKALMEITKQVQVQQQTLSREKKKEKEKEKQKEKPQLHHRSHTSTSQTGLVPPLPLNSIRKNGSGVSPLKRPRNYEE